MAKVRSIRAGLLEAQKLVRDLGLHMLPIDPLKIARDRDIHVEAADVDDQGVSGMLLRVGNSFAIVYATHISSKGFKHFSIAHELGHYFLPGHPEKLFSNGVDAHRSRAGFAADDPLEREADDFAAGLLMPAELIKRELGQRIDGLKAVEALVTACKTSLVASAIRYIDVTSAPAAIVVSRNDHVDFCFTSDELREFPGVFGIRKGAAVPKGSVTERFNRNQALIERGAKDSSDGVLSDWFEGVRHVEILEEVVGLGSYGRVLTVLTATATADEDADEEEREARWEPPTFR